MSTRSKDRTGLCTFTFADGRHCNSALAPANSQFCLFHARKEAQARVTAKLAGDIRLLFSGKFLTAYDLSTALGRVFLAAAEGDLNRKTAVTLAYIAQSLVQAVRLAQVERADVFASDYLCDTLFATINNHYERLQPPRLAAPPPTANQPALPSNSSSSKSLAKEVDHRPPGSTE
jgi:hypothetical protein